MTLNSVGEVDIRAVVNNISSFQRIRFQASLEGDHLAARLTWFHHDGGQTVSSYDLLRGKAADRAGIVCPTSLGS